MRFELLKYNIDKVSKLLADVEGKSISINETLLEGVKAIEITDSIFYDADPCPEEGYDGGKRDMITITFRFDNGSASHSFCPLLMHCEIAFEEDDLWIFRVEDLKQYIDGKKLEMEYKLQEYDAFLGK